MAVLNVRRVARLLTQARSRRILVLGDVMLDRFIRGRVQRISPEAPVPVLEFESENCMPGGAANVARNVTALGAVAELIGVVGRDPEAAELRASLEVEHVGCQGLITTGNRPTTTKTRLVAGQQQIVRLDREKVHAVDPAITRQILKRIDKLKGHFDAVIVGDYGKGLVTQELLDGLRDRCRENGRWLSMDPKPVHRLNLKGISLLTPNRKEAFALAGVTDRLQNVDPLKDTDLLKVVEHLLAELRPAVLLITLGELGLLMCQYSRAPVHIPTVAREVFDVSGAGDTVIAAYTLGISLGADPEEAAVLANHAAGIVVGKRGTATVSAEELQHSFD